MTPLWQKNLFQIQTLNAYWTFKVGAFYCTERMLYRADLQYILSTAIGEMYMTEMQQANKPKQW